MWHVQPQHPHVVRAAKRPPPNYQLTSLPRGLRRFVRPPLGPPAATTCNCPRNRLLAGAGRLSAVTLDRGLPPAAERNLFGAAAAARGCGAECCLNCASAGL